MTPIVSLVVPVHDVAPHLDRCVRSLLTQSEDNIEIVLVDDGATDGSGDRCDYWAGQDSRVQVWHQTNQGLSAARNAGLALAGGEYVGFIDGDDWVEPALVADLVEVAQRTGAGMVVAGCFVDHEDHEGRVMHREERRLPDCILRPGHEIPDTPHLPGLFGYAWNKLYRREALVEAGLTFETDLWLIEDVVFNSAVARVVPVVALSSTAHVHYVQRARLTLGTRHHPDFLGLRMRAVDCLDDVFERWGAAEPERVRILGPLRHDALRGLVRRVATTPMLSRSGRSDHLRTQRQLHGDLLRACSRDRRSGTWLARQATRVFLAAPPKLLLAGDGLLRRARRLAT